MQSEASTSTGYHFISSFGVSVVSQEGATGICSNQVGLDGKARSGHLDQFYEVRAVASQFSDLNVPCEAGQLTWDCFLVRPLIVQIWLGQLRPMCQFLQFIQHAEGAGSF